MNSIRLLLEKRILLSILLPVVLVGLLISVLSIYFFAPPLLSLLQNGTDSNLKLASGLALAMCEDRLNYLLDLRLENDPQMVTALRRETIEEVKAISRRFHSVNLAVVDEKGKVLGSSLGGTAKNWHVPPPGEWQQGVSLQQWGDVTVRMHCRYFPFWRWRLVSFITDAEYMRPIKIARRMVFIGTFGVLIAIVFTSVLAFNWMVDVPLRSIIYATKGVAEGRFNRVYPRRDDEIGKVASAFNAMVDGLEQNQRKIGFILSQLQESEELYRLVTEHSLATIIMLRRRKILFANSRAERGSDFSLDQLIGMDGMEIVHREDRAWVSKRLDDLEAGVRTRDHLEFRYRRKGQEEGWVEVLAVPITYKGKKAILVHGIDVTERKKSQLERENLEARLRHSQKMEAVGTLAGGIAHDFNNLLQAIQGYAELIHLRSSAGSDQARAVEAIMQSAVRGSKLVRQLLTFGRKVESQPTPLNLNDQVEQVTDLLLRTIPRMIRIEVKLAPDLRLVSADPVQMEQVIVNLAVNAKDAMPDGGVLTIETSNVLADEELRKSHPSLASCEYVKLRIADTGVGMDSGVRDHIFEPFFSTKGLGDGAGLGLSMVYGIVANHGGTIVWDSEVAKGTWFDIYLPAIEGEGARQVETDAPHLVGGSETVLLVDDEEAIRDLGATMLGMMGYRVVVAANGKEALEVYRSCVDEIDLIILDLVMPEMSGAQCLEHILELNPRAKVLIASGYLPDADRNSSLDSQAKGFIQKPYKLDTMLKAMRDVLDRAGG